MLCYAIRRSGSLRELNNKKKEVHADHSHPRHSHQMYVANICAFRGAFQFQCKQKKREETKHNV